MKKNPFLLIFICIALNANAQWQQTNGPSAGSITALAMSGNNIFAGTNGNGVYLSSNNGSTWTAVNNGLTNTDILSLAISDSNIFAGTQFGGIFLSTNNGSSWTAVNAGLTSNVIYALAVSGNNIVAGTEFGGVFLSTNNGGSWTHINSGIGANTIYSFTVSGNTIFAGAPGAGVYRSTNNGVNWGGTGAGLPAGYNVTSLAASGSNIFAGTDGNGVFFSSNNGNSWTPANTGLNTDIRSLAISDTTIFAGTWGSGIFLSTNNGSTWTMADSGLTNYHVQSLCVSGSNIFAGTFWSGAFLSSNSGSSWAEINTGLTTSDVRSLAVSSNDIYTGTNQAGVFLSHNSGAWEVVNTGFSALGNSIVNSIAINGSYIYAGTLYGIFISPDSGISWTFNSSLPNNAYTFNSIAIKNDTVLAATDGGGVILSTDFGAHWVSANNGLTNLYVQSLVIRDSTIFAAGSGGVYISTDNCNSWTPVNNGLSDSPSCLASSENNIIGGMEINTGVFLSNNNGSSWTSINSGLGNRHVHSLLSIGANVFAGTDSGVFLSVDTGYHWTSVATNLSSFQINTLTTDGTNLFAGTLGGGVWKQNLSEILGPFANNTWPGDCNYDLTVDYYDFLYLGLAYNDTGPARPNASLNWIPQPASNWSNSFPSGINHKHADTNGDGVVNANDSVAIYMNYGQTHPLRQVHIQQSSDPNFYLVPDHNTIAPGDTVTFEIHLGGAVVPIDSLYGIAFSFLFDPSLVDTNRLSLSYSPSVLGSINGNMLSFEKDFYSSGKIDVALTRIDHLNASNLNGVLGKFQLVVSQNISSISTLYISSSNVLGITSNENFPDITFGLDSVIINPAIGIKELSGENGFLIFPNPVRDQLSIQSENEMIREVKIFDSTGRKVFSGSPMYTRANISVGQFMSGIYSISVTTGHTVIHKKVQIVR